MRRLAFALALALAPALASAQTPTGVDARILIEGDAAPDVDDPFGFIDFANATPGERYSFTLNLTDAYSTFEFRVKGDPLAVERIRQVVPLLWIDPSDAVACGRAKGTCEFPLFEPFPDAEIWAVDGPARVFFVEGTANDITLKLGVPGPVNATLLLARDVTPPGFTLGPIRDLAEGSFYQETTTDELALADLQIREVGAAAWIQNPTPQYHTLQRFPVQGLDADTSYEARVLFTDWAGNTATSATYDVRTPPRAPRPEPVVRPLEPLPNSTIEGAAPVVRASFESPLSPVLAGDVRLFFDQKEVSEGATVTGGGVVTYYPGTLKPGMHRVLVEVRNEAGGLGRATWTFDVAGPPPRETPWPALPFFALALALAVALRRRG